MLVFLHEMLFKVPTPLIWLLKPYGLAVPSSLIQNSSLVLRSEVSRVGFIFLDFEHAQSSCFTRTFFR